MLLGALVGQLPPGLGLDLRVVAGRAERREHDRPQLRGELALAGLGVPTESRVLGIEESPNLVGEADQLLVGERALDEADGPGERAPGRGLVEVTESGVASTSVAAPFCASQA